MARFYTEQDAERDRLFREKRENPSLYCKASDCYAFSEIGVKWLTALHASLSADQKAEILKKIEILSKESDGYCGDCREKKGHRLDLCSCGGSWRYGSSTPITMGGTGVSYFDCSSCGKRRFS